MVAERIAIEVGIAERDPPTCETNVMPLLMICFNDLSNIGPCHPIAMKIHAVRLASSITRCRPAL